MNSPFTAEELSKKLRDNLEYNFRINPEEATSTQIYKALSNIVVDHLKEKRHKFMTKCNSEGKKQVYYISMEFLMGRSLKTSLYNIGLNEVAEQVLKKDYDLKIDTVYDEEPDAGLGNGGLGRLAACYMDGMATCAYPATGYSLLYEYGIFKQKIMEGWQTELPDNWLPGGESWLVPVPDQAIEVHFDGEVREYWDNEYHHISHVNYTPVMAVPYDMYVSGYDSKGVSKLRLWSAENMSFDMSSFNTGDYAKALGANNIAHSISKVLYPNDNHAEGKALRLRQQYFLVSASIQDIVQHHLHRYGTVENLPEKTAIQINDTHPTLAIPELMRILLDECGYGWDDAWKLVTATVAYTNHTVMAEALEKWPQQLFQSLLPRIYQIVCEINRRYCEELWAEYPGDNNKVAANAILEHGQIKMATLCLVAAHTINGVSALHSEILKHDIFKDYYEQHPSKFTNVTNGITHRRWVQQANPGLSALLCDTIGTSWIKDASNLKKFENYKSDAAVLERLQKVKRENKERLADYIKANNNVVVNPDSIFDIQSKRLHEYKRQLLNAMNILNTYYDLKDNPNLDICPRTFVFGAKAASSYYMAKQIIRFIWQLGEVINNDKSINDKLKVVFLENYRVSLAEIMMPAAEISEQISIAGKEASGTGNMKFMINGAVTIGTMDGANVEIHDAVGDENMFIFGMSSDEVQDLYNKGYDSTAYYMNDARIKRVIDGMRRGVGDVQFNAIADNLILGNGSIADPYMCLADFDSYVKAQKRVNDTYLNKKAFNKMSLMNIANAGFFSADRAVKEYADRIWTVKPIHKL